jgi:lipoprotein-anchoring transpeptidase ErfK/SrfK
MRMRNWDISYRGVPVLLLALLLSFCPLLFRGDVHAQIVRSTAHLSVAQEEYGGKVIVVSLSRQWLYAYQNGHRIFTTAVMTGRPGLGTPAGTYHIFAKLSPTTFTSPFPRHSVNWYPPTHINYALEWKAGGFFLHDSWWHSVYGPGTNGWHYDPVDGWQSGSHGCIAMPLRAAAWLYHWAPIGTTLRIVG